MTTFDHPVRVLLIDDHPLVRDGIRMRLETQAHIQVIGEAADGESALAWLARQPDTRQPDLVVTDIAMRGMSGIALAEALHERYPEIAVMVVTMHDNLEFVRQALRVGAGAYVLKDAPADELVAAIQAVLAGRIFCSGSIARRMAEDDSPVDALTRRERDILARIARGMSNKMIAGELGLSVRTVETHRLNIKRKLGIEGQAELVKYAVEHSGDAR